MLRYPMRGAFAKQVLRVNKDVQSSSIFPIHPIICRSCGEEKLEMIAICRAVGTRFVQPERRPSCSPIHEDSGWQASLQNLIATRSDVIAAAPKPLEDREGVVKIDDHYRGRQPAPPGST